MNIEIATFGAGCFWGVEKAFQDLPGVKQTRVGYSGGRTENPTYEQVCSKTTGHAEVVRIDFDSEQISYEKLLQIFWEIHDPTQLNRQGGDIGDQYRSVIFYHSEDQHKKAQESLRILSESKRYPSPIVTEIKPAPMFYQAEEYHQCYLKKQKGLHP